MLGSLNFLRTGATSDESLNGSRFHPFLRPHSLHVFRRPLVIALIFLPKLAGTRLSLYGVTDTVRPILDAFEADTGIKVDHLTMKNGEILQRLKNEAASGVVIADLWFTGGADTFINAAAMGLLLSYASENGKALRADMKDPGHCWYGTSLTLVNWVVNKDLIAKKKLKMPETWNDLLQEGLRGEVSMPDPASSGTAVQCGERHPPDKGRVRRLGLPGPAYQTGSLLPRPRQRPREPGRQRRGHSRDQREQRRPRFGDSESADQAGLPEGRDRLVAAAGRHRSRERRRKRPPRFFIDWILSKRGMGVMAKTRNAAVARDDVASPEGIVDMKTVALFPTDFQANAADPRRDSREVGQARGEMSGL